MKCQMMDTLDAMIVDVSIIQLSQAREKWNGLVEKWWRLIAQDVKMKKSMTTDMEK